MTEDFEEAHRRLQRVRSRLQEDRDISLKFLSCKELPHFVGLDAIEASDGTTLASASYWDPDFHCEITLYQEDNESNVCFRHIGARLLDGEIVDWQTIGIPDSRMNYYRQRVLIIYRILYPEGLTIEDMKR